MSTTDEDPQDAYLKQALRHAPDADAAPPPHLSEAILRAARSAATPPSVRPARASKGPSALQALWNWIALPRVATGFASLMVATLAGVMWWGEPIEPMQAPPAGPTRESSAPAARDVLPTSAPAAGAATPEPAVAPAAPAPPVTAPALVAKSVRPESPASHDFETRALNAAPQAVAPPRPDRGVDQASLPAQRVAPDRTAVAPRSEHASPPVAAAPLKERAETAVASRSEAAARADAAQPPTNAPFAATTPQVEVGAADASPRHAAGGGSPTPAAPAPTPAPPTVPPSAAAPHAAPAPPTAVAAAVPATRSESEATAGTQPNEARGLERRRPAAGKTTTARAEVSAGLGALAQPSTNLALGLQAAPRSAFGRLQADIAAAPARWQWRLNDGEPRAADVALLDWLARVNRAASTGSAPAAEGAATTTGVVDASEADTALTHTLTLLLDGKPHRLVQFGTGRVRLTAVEGRLPLQDAALAPAVVDDLQRSIDALAR